jgi:hypothetical protein
VALKPTRTVDVTSMVTPSTSTSPERTSSCGRQRIVRSAGFAPPKVRFRGNAAPLAPPPPAPKIGGNVSDVTATTSSVAAATPPRSAPSCAGAWSPPKNWSVARSSPADACARASGPRALGGATNLARRDAAVVLPAAARVAAGRLRVRRAEAVRRAVARQAADLDVEHVRGPILERRRAERGGEREHEQQKCGQPHRGSEFDFTVDKLMRY